jgi:hypothetical protein
MVNSAQRPSQGNETYFHRPETVGYGASPKTPGTTPVIVVLARRVQVVPACAVHQLPVPVRLTLIPLKLAATQVDGV